MLDNNQYLVEGLNGELASVIRLPDVDTKDLSFGERVFYRIMKFREGVVNSNPRWINFLHGRMSL